MRRFFLAMLIVVAAIMAAVWQQSFIAALGLPWSTLDLPLFITLFGVSIFDDRIAFAFFVIANTTGSIIAGQALLTPLIAGLATCILLNELLERFFTNRAYYSVITIAMLGWLIYGLLLSMAFGLYRLLDAGPTDAQVTAFASGKAFLLALFGLWLFLTVAYAVTVLVSKRIRSYFIVSDRA